MKITGIVLRLSQYKDKDAVITVLTKDGAVNFLARGVFSIDSKNKFALSPLTYGEYTLNDSKTGRSSLKEAFPIIGSDSFIGDFNKLAVISFFNEITLKMFPDEELEGMYDFLLKELELLKTTNNVLPLVLLHLARCLKLSGYGLNVDYCVITGEKNNIVGISFDDGGFVSEKAFNAHIHTAYSKNQLLIIRYIFKVEPQDIKDVELDSSDCKKILNDLFIYAYNQTGGRFKSEELIKKIA